MEIMPVVLWLVCSSRTLNSTWSLVKTISKLASGYLVLSNAQWWIGYGMFVFDTQALSALSLCYRSCIMFSHFDIRTSFLLCSILKHISRTKVPKWTLRPKVQSILKTERVMRVCCLFSFTTFRFVVVTESRRKGRSTRTF